MPVPEMIWLKTAKAPSPSAASVDAPAKAAPGTSIASKIATATSVFIVSASRGDLTAGLPSGPIRPTPPGNYSARSWSAPGDVEHRRIEPEGVLTDRLEHSIDRGRHQRAGAEVTERAFGGIVLVRASPTHDLDNLGRDVQADLRRQVLGPVGERPTLGQVGVVPTRGGVGQDQSGRVEVGGQLADVALDGRIHRDGDVLRSHDALPGVVHREGQRRLGDAEIDRRVTERKALDDAAPAGSAGIAEHSVARYA